MKKISLIVATLMMGLGTSAKSMTEIWKMIPDSVIPYVDSNHRLEMTEFIGMGLNGEVDNMLQGKSTMDTLTSNYIHLTLNESMTMEIKRLPYQQGDSILCVVKTWNTPQAESVVEFYHQDWQPLAEVRNIGESGGKAWDELPFGRSDSMSEDEYQNIIGKIDFVMTSARLSAENNDLIVSRAAPLIPSEDKEKVKTILSAITMKWDGTTFR